VILIAQSSHGRQRTQNAFTLVEVIMAAALAGIMFLTAIAGFSNAFSTLQLDRENSRATQILLEKTEMLRVYNWDQITGKDATTYIPTTFTTPFYPGTNNSNGGFSYSGTVVITNLVTTASYSNDLRTVTITLTWISGKASRSRAMTTYVSQYGLQNTIN
jgi:prepilin-type N-terminal cleavage/methylation domain-containing protein